MAMRAALQPLPLGVRYAAARVESALEAALAAARDGVAAAEDAQGGLWERFMGELPKPLTSTLRLGGRAMAPTFNRGPPGGDPEMLVVRKMPRPSLSTIFSGDVVAFRTADGRGTLVRRVAAVEGDEMVSSCAEDEPFCIPRDHCWVLADNADLPTKEATDSRTFGPLPVERILGRVVYSCRSAVDHGAVENSESANVEDQPVLSYELDIETLFSAGEGEK